jgi:hypothetical protein
MFAIGISKAVRALPMRQGPHAMRVAERAGLGPRFTRSRTAFAAADNRRLVVPRLHRGDPGAGGDVGGTGGAGGGDEIPGNDPSGNDGQSPRGWSGKLRALGALVTSCLFFLACDDGAPGDDDEDRDASTNCFVGGRRVSCSGDQDDDGVINSQDECPTIPANRANGCPSDDDRDFGVQPDSGRIPNPPPRRRDAALDPDMEAPMPPPEDPCDRDDDGARAENCGGDDCNDQNNRINPNMPDNSEDGIDQNCDGYDGLVSRTVNCRGSEVDVDNLAQAIREAEPNTTVTVCGGTHRGRFSINKNLTIQGMGDVIIAGDNTCGEIIHAQGDYNITFRHIQFVGGQIYAAVRILTIEDGSSLHDTRPNDSCAGSLIFANNVGSQLNGDRWLTIRDSDIVDNICRGACIITDADFLNLRNVQVHDNSAGTPAIFWTTRSFDFWNVDIRNNRGTIPGHSSILDAGGGNGPVRRSHIHHESVIASNRAASATIRLANTFLVVRDSSITGNSATGAGRTTGGIKIVATNNNNGTSVCSENSGWFNNPNDVVIDTPGGGVRTFQWERGQNFLCDMEDNRCEVIANPNCPD